MWTCAELAETILSKQLPPLHVDADVYPLPSIRDVPTGIERKRLVQRVFYILRRKIAAELRAKAFLRRVYLPGEDAVRGESAYRAHHAFRIEIHGVIPGVRQQSGAKIKHRTVFEALTAPQNGDVVQMAIFVAKQHVHLEQQRQVRAESFQASEPRDLLRNPRHFTRRFTVFCQSGPTPFRSSSETIRMDSSFSRKFSLEQPRRERR